jgi:hypothetical protein
MLYYKQILCHLNFLLFSINHCFNIWQFSFHLPLYSICCDCMVVNYLCNWCLSPLKFWVWIPLMARCTEIQLYVIKFVSDLWQVSGFPPTNKTDRNNIVLKYSWKFASERSSLHIDKLVQIVFYSYNSIKTLPLAQLS